MPTTTNVEKVKLNLMTTAQYTAATKDPTQLYMVTDAQISYNDLSNKPNLATVATTGSYNDLSNKPTIPTVNNATLTIQKNGTTVKTFTANASSNVTCNITVPTDTADLTNGAGYTTNVGTVTSVNNVSPVNGNVTLSIPSEVTESTVSGWGFTKNTGTVTSVNNVSPVSGNVTLSIPTVNNATLTIQKNGTTVKTFTANASSDVTCNITVPTQASDIGAQETLVSGTNIKTINNTTILGSGNINIESLPSQSGQSGKYLTTNGTTASWGIPKTFDLLDWKWSDHELSDQSWLRADTFSWQDGTVYSDAYNHLVADYQGGTSKTETIGSYTISYVLATDGHKITTDVATVANIYNESGVAWYYVLDTTNHQFKLPRKRSMQIVESVFDDTINSWYRLYSDGWIEQGGWDNGTLDNADNLTLLKEMADTSYTILMSPTNRFYNGTSPGSDNNWLAFPFVNKSTTQFQVKLWDSDSGTSRGYWPFYWMVKGKSAVDVSGYQADEKYMYFYVGEFSQTATEQTAGLNAELFTGKVDLDFNNMNPSETAKQTIVGWGMPNYSAAVSVATNTDTSKTTNGIVYFSTTSTNNGRVYAFVDNVEVYSSENSNAYMRPSACFFVPKGKTFRVNSNVSMAICSFAPCIGG